MTEHQNSSIQKPERAKAGKYSKLIILAALIVLSTLTVFVVVNNQLAARTAYTAFAEDNSPGLRRDTCCSIGSGNADEQSNQLGQAALNYFSASGGDISGLQAYVEDFGCHQEVSLVRSNTLIKKYGYDGTSFYDITP